MITGIPKSNHVVLISYFSVTKYSDRLCFRTIKINQMSLVCSQFSMTACCPTSLLCSQIYSCRAWAKKNISVNLLCPYHYQHHSCITKRNNLQFHIRIHYTLHLGRWLCKLLLLVFVYVCWYEICYVKTTNPLYKVLWTRMMQMYYFVNGFVMSGCKPN